MLVCRSHLCLAQSTGVMLEHSSPCSLGGLKMTELLSGVDWKTLIQIFLKVEVSGCTSGMGLSCLFSAATKQCPCGLSCCSKPVVLSQGKPV